MILLRFGDSQSLNAVAACGSAARGRKEVKKETIRTACYDFAAMKPHRGPPAERFEAALAEIGAYFLGSSPIQKAAADIARRLEALDIDYAIAGALCLAAHGVIRATEDVDILISREGLDRFKHEWEGRGYVPLRPGGKAVRDTAHGVKVDFLIAGDYPGDGRPKPVSFPEPGAVAVAAGPFRIVALPRFLEMKLASGMTAPHRLQDLADVQRLVAVAKLPRDFGESLDPYVRSKFYELWETAQHTDDDY